MTGERNPRAGASRAGAATNSAGGGAVKHILPRGADIGRADASVVPPSDGRQVVRAITRCATCGSVTVHPFAEVDDVNGSRRRGACGHRYAIRVRRVLTQWAGAA